MEADRSSCNNEPNDGCGTRSRSSDTLNPYPCDYAQDACAPSLPSWSDGTDLPEVAVPGHEHAGYAWSCYRWPIWPDRHRASHAGQCRFGRVWDPFWPTCRSARRPRHCQSLARWEHGGCRGWRSQRYLYWKGKNILMKWGLIFPHTRKSAYDPLLQNFDDLTRVDRWYFILN